MNKNRIFAVILAVSGVCAALCLLCFPLLLPTENYWKLVLQLSPVAVLVCAALIFPARLLAGHIAKKGQSPETPQPDAQEPLKRQISDLQAQVARQRSTLSGQQEQIQVMTQNMREGLLLISAKGTVLSCNHAALGLLGIHDPPAENRDVYSLNDSAPFRECVGHAISGTHSESVLYIGETAVQLIANPVLSGETVSGAVLVLLDVTEREKRDALRREFTSNVSHELKTPLTSIYGIADMIASGLVKAEDIGGFAGRIRDESARMIALIEDIIRLSRLDDESFSEEMRQIDLFEIAGNVCEQLKPSAQERQITMDLFGGPAEVTGVPVIVEEMLYNLCDNAIKYNVEGGRVRVEVSGEENEAVFSVADTGIGIPQGDLDRIFERFYRVDKSHSRRIGGTGLGLSIVKHGAAFHNAKIDVRSTLGTGTTVTLTFPKNPEPPPQPPKES